MSQSIGPTHTESRRHKAEAAIIILATLACITAVWLLRHVLVPLSIAVVVAMVLRPLVRRLERVRLPAPAAATIVVLSTLAFLVALGAALQPPLRTMADDVPRSISLARAKFDEIAARIRRLAERASASAPVGQPRPDTSGRAQPTGAAATKRSGAPQGGGAPTPPASTLQSAFGVTASLLTKIVEEVLLVFFLLAAGETWITKLERIARLPERARLWASIAGEMRDVVSRYILVTLFINLGQAIIIGLAIWAIGLPSPLLWATLTFVAEFIPYLGGLTMVALLLLAGLAMNQGLVHALIAPAVYLAVTALQNNL